MMKEVSSQLVKRAVQWARIHFQRPQMTLLHAHGMTFLCPSPIMEQFAKDLIKSLDVIDTLPRSEPVLVYVGLHRHFGRYWLLPGFKLGVQTEQLFDEIGKRMWASDLPEFQQNIDVGLRYLDALLDLSNGNRKYYIERHPATLSDIKVLFGPHIFPRDQVTFRPGSDIANPTAVFYGSLGDEATRRRRVIEDFGGCPVLKIPTPLFGSDLSREIERADAVLNVHFDDGTYAEAPRLLSAYLHGKPVISESLGHNFTAGKHFLPLEACDMALRESVFREFSQLVTDTFSFKSALQFLTAE